MQNHTIEIGFLFYFSSAASALSLSGQKNINRWKCCFVVLLFCYFVGGIFNQQSSRLNWLDKKISINKNKQIYFFLFFLYFSILIFYTSPRQWGLRGDLLLAKDEIVISCLLESWYCLPDSHVLHVCNPETRSRVTLDSFGTVFQTDWLTGQKININR